MASLLQATNISKEYVSGTFLKKRNLALKEISFSESLKCIIWSTGFRYNFSWIKLDINDENGMPIQKRGVTKYKGLYFMGLQWMHSAKSAQFIGVAEDAEFIVNDMFAKKII